MTNNAEVASLNAHVSFEHKLRQLLVRHHRKFAVVQIAVPCKMQMDL